MAKEPGCSRADKTPSQLEPSDCRHCPTVVIRISLAFEKEKKGIIQFGASYFYSPLKYFTHSHRYDADIHIYRKRISLIIIIHAFSSFVYKFISRMYSRTLCGFLFFSFLFSSLHFTRGIFFFDGLHFGYLYNIHTYYRQNNVVPLQDL